MRSEATERNTLSRNLLADPFSLFVSQASFWSADYVNISSWIEHAPFAFWIVEALKPRVIVELGTHRGFSYLAFCQAVQRLALKTRCFAVDTWKGDQHAGFYEEEVFEQLREYNDRQYGSFSRLVRSTFDDALSQFADRSIDLLHVDGRHFYEDVRHDFETWVPKLSDSALVLFHDTNVQERDFGVFRFWMELKAKYPHFEFVHGHGLGVLGTGKQLPRKVSALLEASDDEYSTEIVQLIYSRLGAASKDRFSLALQAPGRNQLQAAPDRRDADLAIKGEKFEHLNESLELTKTRERQLEAALASALDEMVRLQRSKTFGLLRLVPSLRKRLAAIARHLSSHT